MKPVFTKKNGTSQRVAAIEVKMPASYPSANVTYGSGSVEDALDELNGLSVQKVAIYSDYNYTANTNGYISNISIPVPTGYELVAVLNVLIADVATKPVFLRSWYQNGAAVVIYWSNTGSSAAIGNIVAELLLKPVV